MTKKLREDVVHLREVKKLRFAYNESNLIATVKFIGEAGEVLDQMKVGCDQNTAKYIRERVEKLDLPFLMSLWSLTAKQ